MPRYYFHLCNGAGLVKHEEGQELPDLETARTAAIRSARSIMASDVQRGSLDLSSFIDVEARTGSASCRLTFDEAVDLTRRH